MTVQGYGTLANGQEVRAFILENRWLELVILDYGLRAVSLTYKPTNQQLIMGQWPIDRYESDDAYVGAVVGRTCNRIQFANFKLNNKTYSLDSNDGENHLHGGLAGFHNRCWEVEESNTSLVCRTRSPDGEAGYPGNVDIKVTITLDGPKLNYAYEATTDQDTLCDLTNHAYFCLDNSGSICDHELMITANQFVPVASDLIPTGVLSAVEDTPFDFNQFKPVGKALAIANNQTNIADGFDHCFVLSKSRLVKLYSPLSNLEMVIETDLPGVQLYTGNFLDAKHAALCLETQHLPNACNQADFDTPLITPERGLLSETSYSFSERPND